MPSHVNVDRARERLLAERERLQRIADGLSADLGTEMFEREKDLSILERVEAERADVDRALKRLEDGTYGLCEACGREIAKARLEIRPAARFCVDDQAAAEREGRAS
jgi:RNA polymerase-binding transcription factor DksA